MRVWDDADTALRVNRLFEGDGKAMVKLAELLTALTVDMSELDDVEDVTGFLCAVCWDCCCLDIDGTHVKDGKAPKVFDWEADAAYIAPSLLMEYGVSWDEARYRFSYRQLLEMVGTLKFRHGTPMGEALFYRTEKPPEPRKGNAEERRAFMRRKSSWALKGRPGEDSRGNVNDRMNEAFASLERMARRAEDA